MILNHVLGDINMKLMFNEIGGQKFNSGTLDCKDCVFRHSEWCNIIDSRNPLYKWCGYEIYIETSLDIFDL